MQIFCSEFWMQFFNSPEQIQTHWGQGLFQKGDLAKRSAVKNSAKGAGTQQFKIWYTCTAQPRRRRKELSLKEPQKLGSGNVHICVHSKKAISKFYIQLTVVGEDNISVANAMWTSWMVAIPWRADLDRCFTGSHYGDSCSDMTAWGVNALQMSLETSRHGTSTCTATVLVN